MARRLPQKIFSYQHFSEDILTQNFIPYSPLLYTLTYSSQAMLFITSGMQPQCCMEEHSETGVSMHRLGYG